MAWSIGAGLEGAGVIVTGAARGIGREVAHAFASSGARVMASDVNAEGLADVVRSLPGDGHVGAGLDLADVDSLPGFVAQAAAELGGIDVLAHVAGVARRRTILEVTTEDWDIQHTVNLKAAFFLNRAVAESMKARGRGGRIINFSSQGFWTGGFGGSVVYNATKGGIVTMSRGLARTYGPDGILINTVAPGLVDTPMLRTGLSQDAFDALVTQCPLGRAADPAEIAGTVVFLASSHASYISGATINVSGAFLMY